MQTTKYTFWKLLREYKIEIPKIQRDYAQGRNIDKIPQLRKDFLQSLYNAICQDNKSLDFDFVYGAVEIDKIDNKLLPLDGQQRLTTLFLLHWYLATKENEINEINEIKAVLSKFSYETRISSRDFCNSLVENGVTIPFNNTNVKVSDLIKDAYWFYTSWDKDPTIRSMLTMIDDIHSVFKEVENGFEKLKRDIDSNPPITFRFLELKNFGLTDNLYIKMNARGKALTDFENFKAKFIQVVSEILPARLTEFSTKIDTVWTHIFWEYKESDTIDNPFMRYMYFITEMLYVESQSVLPTTNPFLYNESSIPRINYDLIKVVYNNKENISFLIDAFDFWSKIKTPPNRFMDEIFSERYNVDKVVIFDGKCNLWKRCLEGDSFGISEKTLLYTLIKRAVILDEYSSSKDVVELLRVIRNLLLRVRQASNNRYNSNLRFDFMKRQLKDIAEILVKKTNIYQLLIQAEFGMTGFAKESVDSEVNKAIIIKNDCAKKESIHQLEDNPLFRGCVDNILDLVKEPFALHLNSYISEVWANDSSLISKALLSYGDYSVLIGHSQLGPRRYLGGEGEWNIILTRTSNEFKSIKQILKQFISTYHTTSGMNSKEKLQTIIKEYLNNAKKDWRYYFIKYDTFISNEKNIYVWRNDFEIRKLDGNTLQSYHCNPYARTIVSIIADKNICDINSCYSINSDLSPLILKNNIRLENLKDGWRVRFPEEYASRTNNREYNMLSSIANSKVEFWLKETSTKDRIEVAKEFIMSVYI
jgi:hypothetical protein